jgi:carboxyl-terminal processing protease
MQDYGRGIVIGSTSTYGKGTVQRNIALEPEMGSLLNKEKFELGTIKLTLQKFYRINGGSTQLKGVTPNIILPDQYESLKYREIDNPDALPWDEIQKAFYVKTTPVYDLDQLKNKSGERVKANSSFTAIHEISDLIEKTNDKEYSLQLTKYRNDQKNIRDAFKRIEEMNNSQKNLEVAMLTDDEKKLMSDNDKLERRKQWINALSKDVYINETCQIIEDMIKQGFLVSAN